MNRLPTAADIAAERARRPPRLDNSPEALERVVAVLIEARAVPPDVVALLRAGGVELDEDAVLNPEVEP